ncbi:MAG: dual specificity protein phosphatase family protein [Kouleothrix sp.]|jgi:protein-tyrosine phosphatase|nr:dual specificity protein phosphatase family protein [Kouleothrix sp.]
MPASHSNPSSPTAGPLALLRHRDLLGSYVRTQWRRAFGLNISRVDDLLYVGGQFQARQWPALHALGIQAVLSLQAERADSFDGPPPARTLRLLVPDFHPPTIAQLHEAIAFIAGARAAQLPVMVHCHAGVGRASLTASAFLVAQGLGSIEAFHTVRRARPIVALNRPQLQRLLEWEQLARAAGPAGSPPTPRADYRPS